MSLVHVIGDESIDHNLQRINFIFWINEIITSLRQRKVNGLPFMSVLEHEYYT